MMKTYWFDMLPVHPSPKSLESFTGYLTRLAQHNGLTRFSDLAARLFPKVHPLRVRAFIDYMPPSWGCLPRETNCSKSVLQTTTFFHLARKFGRSPYPRRMNSFMRGAISPHLRYCPLCIAEFGFYRLPWRLLPLTGCHHHGCLLLDICTFCSNKIRLLTVPFQIGICPHCQSDLRKCYAPQLSAEAQNRVQSIYLDLDYLLRSQEWETDMPMTPSVAAGYAIQRERRRLQQDIQHIATQTHISKNGVRAVERGGNGTTGDTLLSYFRYADYLGLSLRQLFTKGLNDYLFLPDTMRHEARLAAQLNHIISHLQGLGELVNDRTVRVWMGVSQQTLRSYTSTSTILCQLESAVRFERETQLLEQVEGVVHDLQNQGKPIHRVDIYRRMNMSGSSLKAYPRIKAKLFPLNRTSPSLKPIRIRYCEKELLKRAQQIVKNMIETERFVRQEDVATELGMSLTHICRAYPNVYAFMGSTRAIRSRQIEADMLTRVEYAVHVLHARDQFVTRKAVAKIVAVSVQTLNRYPGVYTRLKQICDEQIESQKARRVERVVQALKTLQIQGTLLTQEVICREAGLCESAVRHHPELGVIINPALAAQQSQQYQYLLQSVAEAISQLRRDGQKVMMPAVCRLVGMSLAGLRRYPQIVKMVRQARMECRNAYEAKLIVEIEQAASHLKEMRQPITQQAICEILSMSPNTLRYYLRAKEKTDAMTAIALFSS